MIPRWHATLRLLALTAAFGASGAASCWAQTGPSAFGAPGPISNPSGDEVQTKQAPTRTLPPALPGAKSNPNTVAPATKQASEMNPTDALFDAINRGDIGAARDAIDRGADLEGHNVLGMTPIELSIDLSRNDISFLLLSMRGADAAAQPPATAQPAKGRKGVMPIREVRMKVAPVPKVTAPPPPREAKLFSGDGGTPVPAAGFLGFDTASGKN